ncbi:MAG: biopolymer transporter ExbD, partial [Pseudomonadota bacterium]|nr:biopolymer transporter ExbD [Pseudomonadota bacterium]
MNLQPEDEDEPEVNLTPLIDVVFLLLIFFMVSTTFEHQSRIQIELPEASVEATLPDSESLEIIIDVQGRYFIGDQQVVNTRLKTLKGAIRKAIGERKEIPVTKVDKAKARFFKAKHHLPSQKIVETKEDGSLVVSFRVT